MIFRSRRGTVNNMGTYIVRTLVVNFGLPLGIALLYCGLASRRCPPRTHPNHPYMEAGIGLVLVACITSACCRVFARSREEEYNVVLCVTNSK